MSEDRVIKTCCATFYESDLVRALLGNVLHPGGLALTEHLGTLLGLTPTDRVLDVACGRGASAVFVAERFGCHVTGLDYGLKNIAAARAHALEKGLSERTAFRQGDAERLPFAGRSFDGVISECSFCTFPDKATAAAELARVLRPGGRLGLTDMTVDGELPPRLEGLLSWVACIAGAGRPEDYIRSLRQAGFGRFMVEDRRQDLLEMVEEVRKKVLGLDLAVRLGRLDLDVDLQEAKDLAREAVDLVRRGVLGYTLIVAMV